MQKRVRPEPLHISYTDPCQVREEIACIEARLTEIGYDGDCAYENAMIRFFEKQVKMRRDWLLVQSEDNSHTFEEMRGV